MAIRGPIPILPLAPVLWYNTGMENPFAEGGITMASYELVREIKNLCRNNQMRDISFEEVECESPEDYVRSVLRGTDIQISAEHSGDTVTVHASVDGLIQKFVFTPFA